jgi:hypothetical protein
LSLLGTSNYSTERKFPTPSVGVTESISFVVNNVIRVFVNVNSILDVFSQITLANIPDKVQQLKKLLMSSGVGGMRVTRMGNTEIPQDLFL